MVAPGSQGGQPSRPVAGAVGSPETAPVPDEAGGGLGPGPIDRSGDLRVSRDLRPSVVPKAPLRVGSEAYLRPWVYGGSSFDVQRYGGNDMTTAIFDADSHLMETEDWLASFADALIRDQPL